MTPFASQTYTHKGSSRVGTPRGNTRNASSANPRWVEIESKTQIRIRCAFAADLTDNGQVHRGHQHSVGVVIEYALPQHDHLGALDDHVQHRAKGRVHRHATRREIRMTNVPGTRSSVSCHLVLGEKPRRVIVRLDKQRRKPASADPERNRIAGKFDGASREVQCAFVRRRVPRRSTHDSSGRIRCAVAQSTGAAGCARPIRLQDQRWEWPSRRRSSSSQGSAARSWRERRALRQVTPHTAGSTGPFDDPPSKFIASAPRPIGQPFGRFAPPHLVCDPCERRRGSAQEGRGRRYSHLHTLRCEGAERICLFPR